MPAALVDHASTSDVRGAREMDGGRGSEFYDEETDLPSDGQVVAELSSMPNKQSLDYIWRSGLAGGLAGCAVCLC